MPTNAQYRTITNKRERADDFLVYIPSLTYAPAPLHSLQPPSGLQHFVAMRICRPLESHRDEPIWASYPFAIAIDRPHKRGERSRILHKLSTSHKALHTPLLYLHRHLSSKTRHDRRIYQLVKSITPQTDEPMLVDHIDPSLMKLRALIVRVNFESRSNKLLREVTA